MVGRYLLPAGVSARGPTRPCPREPVDKNGLPPHRSHFRKEGSLSLKNHGDGSCKSLKSDLLNGKGGNLLKGSLERGWGICHGKSPVFIKFVIIIYNSIICNIIQH